LSGKVHAYVDSGAPQLFTLFFRNLISSYRKGFFVQVGHYRPVLSMVVLESWIEWTISGMTVFAYIPDIQSNTLNFRVVSCRSGTLYQIKAD